MCFDVVFIAIHIYYVCGRYLHIYLDWKLGWDQKMPTSFEKIQQDWKMIHYQIILLVLRERACSSKLHHKFREGKITPFFIIVYLCFVPFLS